MCPSYIHVWTVELWDGEWLSAMFVDDCLNGCQSNLAQWWFWKLFWLAKVLWRWVFHSMMHMDLIPSGHWVLFHLYYAPVNDKSVRSRLIELRILVSQYFSQPFPGLLTDPGVKNVQKMCNFAMSLLSGRYAKTTPRGIEWETDLKKICTLDFLIFRHREVVETQQE